jgi:hypothetical protein
MMHHLLSVAIDDTGSIGYSFEHNQVKSNASITIHNHNYTCTSFESVACSVKVQTGLCCDILFMLMCVCVCVFVCKCYWCVYDSVTAAHKAID